MSSNPEPSYVPHDTFAQSHLQILRQDKWCTSIRNRSLRQSKPVVVSHLLRWNEEQADGFGHENGLDEECLFIQYM